MHITPIVRVAALCVRRARLRRVLGCERRIIRKEERPFMDYAEQNWRKLTPTQKADYSRDGGEAEGPGAQGTRTGVSAGGAQ